jgi:hypothetical protein
MRRRIRAAFSSRVRKRGVFGAIKRELRHRSAIEPVSHMKSTGISAAATSKAAMAMLPMPPSALLAKTFGSSSPG